MKVPQSQRQLHVASESIALLVIAPFLLGVAQTPTLTPAQRQGLRATAIATILVDGYLLTRWLNS